VVRRERTGAEVDFATLPSPARALRLFPRGELVVATQEALIRFDRRSGARLGVIPIPVLGTAWVSDADFDPSGCAVAVALSPGHVAIRNLCGGDPGWRTIALPGAGAPNSIRGIRYLPDGSLLAAGTVLYHVGPGGEIRSEQPIGTSEGCVLELGESPREVVLGCDYVLHLFDRESGTIVRKSGLAYGIGANSLTAVVPEPDAEQPPARGRRRPAGR
jgi:hypothetical protein